MLSNTDSPCTQALDIVSHPGHPDGRFSQSSASRLLLAPTLPSEYDAERATCAPLLVSRNREELELNVTTTNLSPEMPDSSPTTPTATMTTSRISNATNPFCSQFNNLPQRSSVSDGLPVHVHGVGLTGPSSSEEPTTAALPWYSRTLASFTLYDELSTACTPDEFALVHTRLEKEWAFNGCFLIALAAVNATMFAITTDSEFKIDSYAYAAIATSSAACGLGIACDVWFLFHYAWVALETFTHRSRDVYQSYVSFSLSSRVPTFCTVVSSISLMAFLLLIAFDASPVGVIVIGILVILAMAMQFIVYGTHQFVASALRVWRAGAISTVNVFKRFRGFGRGGQVL